jgi:hypothetical protein
LRHPYLGKSWRIGVLLQDRPPAFIEGSLEFVLDMKGRYGRVQHEYMTIEVCSLPGASLTLENLITLSTSPSRKNARNFFNQTICDISNLHGLALEMYMDGFTGSIGTEGISTLD